MSGKGILLFLSESKEEFLNIGIVNKVTPYFRGGLIYYAYNHFISLKNHCI